MPLVLVEEEAVERCKANLHLVEPHQDYVNGGKYFVPPGDNPFRGKSFLASAALYDFFGGTKSDYHIYRATDDILGDHYWVVNGYNQILDATKDQFDLIGVKPPYDRRDYGKKVSKRAALKKHLPLLNAMRVDQKEPRLEKDLFGRAIVVPKLAVLSDAQQAKLAQAWRALIAEWSSRPDEFIRCAFPKGALVIQFVRAQLYGDEIKRTATMAYTGERFYVAGNAYPYSDILLRAATDDRALRSIRFQMEDDTSFDRMVAVNQPLMGHRMPADFPVTLAKRLLHEYCPKGGKVLDPCHGWGGRLLGFLLSEASSYTGVDPAPHSHKLQEMFDDPSPYLDQPKVITLINKPFEDVRFSEVPESSYDFAFTSPPYFNTEKYRGDESSWRRYPSLQKWIEGFYEPMIWHVADSLKLGAYFALQVTPKFNMSDMAKEIGAEAGLVFDKVFDTNMKRYGVTDSGATDLFEVVVIFRKE